MDNEALLKKWLLGGDLSESEKLQIREMKDHDLDQKILENLTHFDLPDDFEMMNYEQLKSRMVKRKKKVIEIPIIRTLLRIAAVFALVFGGYFIFQSNGAEDIHTEIGEQIDFRLPDNSKVFLNAGSQVSYKIKNWKNNRLVRLDGEAFFDVQKGATFKVQTTNGSISVLGTQFNIQNRNSYFKVTCYEGSVKINSNNYERILLAGDSYVLFQQTETLLKVGTSQPNWLENISSFNSVPLALVFHELERQYPIELVLDNVDTQALFTGSFINNDLDQALISITEAFSLKYQFSDTQKVRIYKSEK